MADSNTVLPPINVDEECRQFAQFNALKRPGGDLKLGWQRQYRTRAVLTQLAHSNYDPNDPFWIVVTDQSMIRNHSDIEEPVFVDFVRQLYDDLVRLKERVPCAPHPAAAPHSDTHRPLNGDDLAGATSR